MREGFKKKLVILLAVILALLMLLPILFSILSLTASAVSRTELEQLQKNAQNLASEKKALEAKLKELEKSQSNAMEKKESLDKQIDVINREIDNTEAQIEEYNGLIADKEAELKAATEKEKEQEEQFKARVREMEENGTVSYFSILFKANSLSDLLGRMDFIGEIMDYDKNLMNNLIEIKNSIAEAQNELKADRASLEEQKANLSQKQKELGSSLAAAENLMASLEQKKEDYAKTYAKMEAEEEKLKNQIAEMIKELERQNKGKTGTGTYIWPAPGYSRITSEFGSRLHPILGVYKSHNGIDIGAPSGANIVAADSGTVITSEYSSSFGNYVVISHGGGLATLYAHMSKRLVSVNDTVSQGDRIGLVGSTGLSTGPHLHFSVLKNGQYVNPMDYLG